MREIKFRGIRTDNGKFVYGYYDCITDNYTPKNRHYITTLVELDNGEVIQVGRYEVIPETVGQYTGLKDNNGNKIFEGDIFKFKDEVWESSYTPCGTEYDSWEVENYAVVGYNEETARFDFVKYKLNENSVEVDLHENHDLEFADFVSELEIIGNIYDNSELLIGDDE